MKNVILSDNIVQVIKYRRLRWTGHEARMEEISDAFKMLTGTPVEKRPLGKPRHKWEDNIRIDLKQISVCTTVGLICLRIGLLESPCEYSIKPLGSINHGISYTMFCSNAKIFFVYLLPFSILILILI